jgi:hypothetical protein
MIRSDSLRMRRGFATEEAAYVRGLGPFEWRGERVVRISKKRCVYQKPLRSKDDAVPFGLDFLNIHTRNLLELLD